MSMDLTLLEAGDRVIVVRGICEPIVLTIKRVTKTLYIVGSVPSPMGPGELRFDRNGGCCGKLTEQGRGRASMYLWSEEAMASLKETQASLQAAAEEQRNTVKQAKAMREARQAALVAETQAACGGSLLGVQRVADVMPDGSRLYLFRLPIQAGESFEGKGGWEMVMIHCVTVERQDWKSDEPNAIVHKVEANVASVNGRTGHGMTNSSVQDADDDADACWYALSDRYHRDW